MVCSKLALLLPPIMLFYPVAPWQCQSSNHGGLSPPMATRAMVSSRHSYSDCRQKQQKGFCPYVVVSVACKTSRRCCPERDRTADQTRRTTQLFVRAGFLIATRLLHQTQTFAASHRFQFVETDPCNNGRTTIPTRRLWSRRRRRRRHAHGQQRPCAAAE
jgi:hypothetical protein